MEPEASSGSSDGKDRVVSGRREARKVVNETALRVLRILYALMLGVAAMVAPIWPMELALSSLFKRQPSWEFFVESLVACLAILLGSVIQSDRRRYFVIMSGCGAVAYLLVLVHLTMKFPDTSAVWMVRLALAAVGIAIAWILVRFERRSKSIKEGGT